MRHPLPPFGYDERHHDERDISVRLSLIDNDDHGC
jgi:hypothetical protein